MASILGSPESICIPVKCSFPGEAAVWFIFRDPNSRKGEAQLLGDASELAWPRWGHVEPSKPLSPRDERARSVRRGRHQPLAPGKGVGTADAGGWGLFPGVLGRGQRWHPLAAVWQGLGASQDADSVQMLSSLYIAPAIYGSPARRPARVYPGDLAKAERHG